MNRNWVPKRAEGNFDIFLYLERSTKILYDIRKLEQFAAFCIYIDKEQLDKYEFDKDRKEECVKNVTLMKIE